MDCVRSSNLFAVEFPSRTFIQNIYDVAQELSTQRFNPKAALIRKTHLDAATLKIATEQGSYSDELNALRSAKLRQSCKRTASINASSSRSVTNDENVLI
jgi:hypothetical protein